MAGTTIRKRTAGLSRESSRCSANSDIHAPLNLDYLVQNGDRRPMTLVFAKERTADAIKKASSTARPWFIPTTV